MKGKGHVGLVCTLTVSVNKNQNYAAFNNNPYITASHQAALIVHVSIKVVLLGLGSDVGIIIEGNGINLVVLYSFFLVTYPL